MFAVVFEDCACDDDTLVAEPWVIGSMAWLDKLLTKAIGEDAVEGIKRRVRAKFSELEEQEADWTIRCDAVESDLLGARPTDDLGIALLRAGLREESGGLIKDLNSDSQIFVALPSYHSGGLEALFHIAMQAFTRLVPAEECERPKIRIYKIEQIMQSIAFDKRGLRHSLDEMKTVTKQMPPCVQRRAIQEFTQSIIYATDKNSTTFSFFSKSDMLDLANVKYTAP